MKKKILKIILFIFILILLFLIIRSTYSKYLTQTDDNASLHIANWNIKLNDKDISENKNFTNNVQIVLDKNEYVEDGVIAPTSSGSFKLKLESTGTELPFKYDLQVAGDGDFDTVSKYNFNVYNYNSWGYGTSLTTMFEFSFVIDYSYRDTPIKRQDESTNYELVYDEVPITFTIPEGSISNLNIYNALSLSYENNVVTFIAAPYSWSDNNILTVSGQASYRSKLEESEIISALGNVSIDGKLIGTPVELPDFKITSYTKNGSERIPVDVNANFSDIVEPPVDADGNFTGEEVINDYTFYFEWYDGEENILDNQGDVDITKITSSAYIPLSLKITQIEDNNLENNKENS